MLLYFYFCLAEVMICSHLNIKTMGYSLEAFNLRCSVKWMEKQIKYFPALLCGGNVALHEVDSHPSFNKNNSNKPKVSPTLSPVQVVRRRVRVCLYVLCEYNLSNYKSPVTHRVPPRSCKENTKQWLALKGCLCH